MVLPDEMNDTLQGILGRPCFACGQIAAILRHRGAEIPRRAEDEQAYVLFWALGLYARHGDDWETVGLAEMLKSVGEGKAGG